MSLRPDELRARVEGYLDGLALTPDLGSLAERKFQRLRESTVKMSLDLLAVDAAAQKIGPQKFAERRRILGETAGASQWPAQNIVVAPMTIATAVAAIFINSRWVQTLALAIQIGGWIYYFAALQTALLG